jgi:hypothetical protein
MKKKSIRRQRYAQFVYWVRKSHSWIGLWGALLGLVFGLSGIWLNHRAMLKLPPMAQHRTHAQVQLPELLPSSHEEMALWLQRELQFSAAPNSVRVESSKPVAWGAKNFSPQSQSEAGVVTMSTALHQPERWLFSFGGPAERTQIEYWKGNTSVSVNTVSNGLLGTLTDLHKGTGMSVAWILLVDSIAMSMIFLSLSGVILWVQMNRRRALGVGILSVSMLSALVVVGVRL